MSIAIYYIISVRQTHLSFQSLCQCNIPLYTQDVMNLRSSEAKLKRQLSQLQDKVRQVEGKRRFDPSKAFQSSENADTSMRQRTPLKGNITKWYQKLLAVCEILHWWPITLPKQRSRHCVYYIPVSQLRTKLWVVSSFFSYVLVTKIEETQLPIDKFVWSIA